MSDRLSQWFANGIARKFLLLLFALVAVQAAQLAFVQGRASKLAEESQLINEAGRQRMRLLLMVVTVKRSYQQGGWEGDELTRLGKLIANQDATFGKLIAHSSALGHPEFHPSVTAAQMRWANDIRPVFSAFDPKNRDGAGLVLARLDRAVPEHLEALDDIVTALAQIQRDGAQRLAQAQWIALALNAAIVALALMLVVGTLLRPLRALIAGSKLIAAGHFEQRVAEATSDELGQLAANFNRMADAVAERTARLRALNQVAAAVTSTLDTDHVLAEIMRSGRALTGSMASCIAFWDAPTERFSHWVADGLSEEFRRRLKFHRGGLAEEAFTTGAHVQSNDIEGARHPLSALAREEGVRCLICLPLVTADGRLGVVLFFRKDRDRYSETEVELLGTFGAFAAQAISNARLHDQAANEARTDGLTGLSNRREFERRIADEQARALRSGAPYALMLLDIDHFKRVNDQYGHASGDEALKSLAQTLSRHMRGIDCAARYGGEEFALLMPGTDSDAARQAAERLRAAVAAAPVKSSAGQTIPLTVSIGVSAYPESAGDPDALKECADQAMYAAKSAGRNRVVCAPPGAGASPAG